MPTMTIGRVGLDTTLSPTPTNMFTRSRDGKTLRVEGHLQASTLADSKAIRAELENQRGQLVAMTYVSDSSYDGFYIQRATTVQARQRDASLQGVGLFRFTVDLDFIGDHASVEFLSNLTGVLASNNAGLIESEVVFFHAPPVAGDDAYTAGGGVTATSRTSEDGAVPTFLDLTVTNGLAAAKWGCAPADYYKGAARVDVDGYTRTGKNVPMQPANWTIGNGLIELRAETFGGASTGDLSIRAYNGSWGSWTSFDVVWSQTTDIPEWHYFNVIKNTPELVIVQLTRDADEAPPTDSRHTLMMSLRRGAPFVSCVYQYTTNVSLSVDRSAVDAGTSITPTEATSATAITDAADDGDGNRWILGGANLSGVDTVNGGIDMASAASHSFFMGYVIDGASADSNNDGAALSLQYMAQMNETVQAVTR